MAAGAPEWVLERLGDRARPVLTARYTREGGWERIPGTTFSDETEAQLREQGVTMVELKWRLARRRFSLTTHQSTY
ncbi:hypothetical protein QDR37_03600 [Amnibacterium sp. CER49]|uniref:hypothetical protein n=1 Tax=Amnibacterium sp. CER49 TaxID=3039161 RepID=UPI00244ABFE5|nr:hypothetical protein [Amnibacterium sp. CER49]MDH2443025.1 hypothetical protein [Amnibacterium sp. CER49]